MYNIITIIALLALITRRIEAQSVLATACYGKSDSVVQPFNAGPCGIVTPTSNFTSCCVSGDTCLADGLCHYAHPMPDAPTVETGYYMGGCTDRSYSAASCPTSCSDLRLPDVVYNQTTKIWHCCGLINGFVRCDTPTDETFSAPAPSALSVTFSVGPTPVTAASSPSSTSPTTSPSASQTSGPQATGGGLSGGAKAGIGAGCAIVGVAIIGLLAWFFSRRRTRHAAMRETPGMDYGYNPAVGGYKAERPVELPSRAPEKASHSVRAELG